MPLAGMLSISIFALPKPKQPGHREWLSKDEGPLKHWKDCAAIILSWIMGPPRKQPRGRAKLQWWLLSYMQSVRASRYGVGILVHGFVIIVTLETTACH